MLTGLRRRGVPAVLVNARMSASSFNKWRRLPGLAASLLGCFDICLAQSEAQAERLRALGARNVACPGNLKFSAEPLSAAEPALAALRPALHGRQVLLFASTHEGEEALAGRLHRRLRPRFPALLTVIVPRHPARAEAISGDLAGRGLALRRRSLGELPDKAADIYLADTMGELGLFYRLAALAVIGGSFVPHGGHNPLEAAQLDCAILYGPDMANFQAIADELAAAKAALACEDEAALESAVARLLSDDGARLALARAAKAVADANRNVVDRVVERLAPCLQSVRQRYG
jgi:3-deoxy-D-manno-octulosonic-acid transferase